MANTGFPDLVSESTVYRDNSKRMVASNAFRAMATPELATAIAATARNYPNVPGAVVLAGSFAGLNPTDDQWKLIEQEQVKMREDRWANSGLAPLDYLLDVGEGTWGIMKSAARGGMITFETLWEEALPRATRTGVLMYQNETLGFGSAYSQASDSTGVRAARVFAKDPMGNVGSALARYMNLLTPFSDPFEVATESRVNIGSGFFAKSDLVSSDSISVQQLQSQGYSEKEAINIASADEYGSPSSQLWRDGAEAVRITGSNGISTGVSLGRLGAMTVSEPGSTPYNWISGAIDAGSQIFLDPSNIVTGGMSKARLATRGLDAAGTARSQFGLINGLRNTVFKTDAEKAWSSGVGLGFAQMMTDSIDTQFIYDSLKKGARGRSPSRALVEELRSSRDLTKTRDILVRASGTEIVQKPWQTSVTGSLLGLDTTVRGAIMGKTSTVNGITLPFQRPLNQVTAGVDEITNSLMPNYGGYRPRLRQRLESNFLYEGGELRRTPGSRNGRATSRLFAQMAGRSINISNLDRGMGEIIDMGRAVDAAPDEIEMALQAWSKLDDSSGFNEALKVVEDLMEPYRNRLRSAGVSEKVVEMRTSVYKDLDEMKRYFVDRAGNIEDPGVFTMLLGNGEEIAVPLAHALSEASVNAIPVPGRDGGRSLRRMTDFLYRSESALNVIRLSEGAKVKRSMFYDEEFNARVGVRAADAFMGLWRNAVLLRPAWTLRVVGEEQTRLAAEGLHVINNPMKGFMLSLQNKNLKLGLTSRRKLMSSDLLGQSLEYSADYMAAQSRRAGGWFDSPGGSGAETWIRVSQEDVGYTKAWYREIAQLQSDEASNFIARNITDPDNPMSLDEIKIAFRDGDLVHVREELMAEGNSARHRALGTDEGADAYIDSLYARAHLKTGGKYETLRDDGWWYDDLGERVREADDADQAILRSSANWGPQTKPGSKVRVKTRTHQEYKEGLIRSGYTPEHVENTMRKLEAETGGDDRIFQALDPDRRTISIDAETIRDTDTITDARVVQYKVTQNGDEELMRAIGTGEYRGQNFDGNTTASVERKMVETLDGVRREGTINVPDYVKGVEQTENSALYRNFIDRSFDMFMGKPTNRYSRSPAFFRSYWRAVDELVTQGVVDERTLKSIQELMVDGAGNPIQSRALRSSLNRSERLEEHMKETQLMVLRYEKEFGDLTGPAGEVVTNLQTKLAAFADADAYDISVYGRAIDGARDDLADVYKQFDDAILEARKAEDISELERVELIKNLEDKKREIENTLQGLDGFSDDALDEVDRVLGERIGLGADEEYVGGFDPATSSELSNRPTQMEDLIARRQSELEQQGELTAREVSARTEGPSTLPVRGERSEMLVNASGTTTRRIDKIEALTDDGHVIAWLPPATAEDGTILNTISVNGQYKVTFSRNKSGGISSSVTRKTDEGWVKSTYRELESYAAARKTRGTRTKVTETERTIPAEVARGPEFDAYATEAKFEEDLARQELEIMSISAREREVAVRELGYTENQLKDAEQIPKIKDHVAQTLRRDKSRAKLFDEALVDSPSQLLSVAEVDKMAKATALTATQDLLYDLSNKSAVSDMLRNIFPFSEAWWEIVSTWSRLVQANPAVLQRFQQAYKGIQEDARPFDYTDEDGNVIQGALPGAEMQVEGYDGAGFFYVDPGSGDEMFALPYLSQILSGNTTAGAMFGGAVGGAMGGFFGGAGGTGVTGALVGGAIGAATGAGISKAGIVPEGESVDLGFRAQGLNMASQSPIPGLGPLASVPVSAVLNLGGEVWDPIKDVLLPFGDPDVETPGSFIDSLAPPYIKKFMQAAGVGESNALRIRANTTMEVAAMMVRQGEGSFNSQEEMRDTLAKASKRAGWLYAIRGFASAGAPTSAGFEFSTKDMNGTWFATQTMVAEWNRIKGDMGGDPVSTFDEFVGLYGIDPRTFMKGKTDTIQDKSMSEQGYAWERANDAMFKQFPGTAYYVNPDSPLDDTFDYDAYLKSLEEGTRVALTPEQWAMKSNQLAANVIIERFRRSADGFIDANGGGTANKFQVTEQLYKLQESLRADFPGYGLQIAGTTSKLSLDQQMFEFERWKPEMFETEAGKGIKLYLAAREEAKSFGMRLGNGSDWWKTSSDWQAVQARQELEAVAAATYMRYPKFQAVYVGVFAYEIQEG